MNDTNVIRLFMVSAFNAKVAERLTGITYRQLDYWDKIGLIKPSVGAATGKGSRRVYSFEDLVELRVVASLRERGLSLQAIRRTVQYLRKHHSELVRPLANLTFVTDGRRIFTLTDDPNRLMALTAAGQFVMALALGPVVSALGDKVRELTSPIQTAVRVRGVEYALHLTPDLQNGGYVVESPDLPGLITEGDTIPHCRAMARDAIAGILDAAAEACVAK